MTKDFLYISAPPGSNKTGFAVEKLTLLKNMSGKSTLFVVPTTDLCDEIVSRGIQAGRRVLTIHGKNINHESSQGTVSKQIELFFKNTKFDNSNFCENDIANRPGTLVITEQSFYNVIDRIKVDNWVLIKDEAQEPIRIIKIHCADSVQLLRTWFAFSPHPLNSELATIQVNKGCPITTTCDDELLGQIHALKSVVQSKHFEVLAQPSRLDKEGLLVYSIYTKPTLYESFAQAYFMGAWFESSYLFNIWGNDGVTWRNVTPDQLDHAQIESSRVSLHYYAEDGGWSRRRRGTKNELDGYIKFIEREFYGKPYLYAANSDLTSHYQNLISGVRIPSLSHGLNRWTDYTNIALMGSYLNPGDINPFYKIYRSDVAFTKLCRQTQMFLQQITRTNLRVKNGDSQINVIVPTKSEAMDLLPFLPNASIVNFAKRHSGMKTGLVATLNPKYAEISPRKSHLFNDGTYTFAQNKQKLIPSVLNLGCQINTSSFETVSNSILSCDDLAPLHERSISFRFKTSLKHPFIEYLRNNMFRIPKSIQRDNIDEIKSIISVYSTARFNGNSFSVADVVENSDLLAFDFDGSELGKRDLAYLFKELAFFWYTSLRNFNSQAPASGVSTRFRVLVPCSRSMSKEEHFVIMSFWQKRIEHYCITKGRASGFDEAALQVSRKWFFPHSECSSGYVSRDKGWLDVDLLLAAIRRERIIQGCADFLDYRREAVDDDSLCDYHVKEIENLLLDFRDDNRSKPSVKIGGLLKHQSLDVKEYYLTQIELLGADKFACKMAREYAYQ